MVKNCNVLNTALRMYDLTKQPVFTVK